MTVEPTLIVEVFQNGIVEERLRANPPQSVADGDVVVVGLGADAEGRLEVPDAGEVVLAVPSPETLVRESDEVGRVIDRAGTGSQPLIVAVEAAHELRQDELDPVLEAARRSPRSVILRVVSET
ncbi:MAG: hypothetical protein QOE86_1397 [Solirubrobacteraceae bacterium]|jgi:hypothetical protein|nr:hypothetical protein [Solirubrobacteraceae bacterium]